MKKIFSLALCCLLMMNTSFAFAAAESDWISPLPVPPEESPITGAGITQIDVTRGLLFCRDYPVTVQIKGKPVSTGDQDVPPVIIGERTLIPVRAFFEAMGAQVSWDDETRMVTVQDGDTRVELVIDSPVTKVDGKEILLDVPAMIIDHDQDGNGSTMVPLRFVSEGLGFQVSWEGETRTANVILAGSSMPVESEEEWPLDVLSDQAKEKTIIIDIGHGGKDPGSIGNEDLPDEIYEKDVNLAIGLKLKVLLEQAGAKFLFTRETDTYMSLYDRPAFANDNGGDIFVSIHNNSSDYAKPEGTEVYYNSKTDENGQDEMALYGIRSKDVGELIQKELVAALGTTDRGAKEGPKLVVLNRTSMPAIVIEGAFMSNPSNLAMIQTEAYKDNYAYAVAKGLIEALNAAF